MNTNNKAAQLNPAALPSVDDAFHQYTTLGGTLTETRPFGQDPLEGNTHQQQIRHELFFEKYANLDPIFHGVVNGSDSLF